MLEETDTGNVTVVDAETGSVLVEVSIIQKLLVQLGVVLIVYVLVEFIDVVQGNVLDAMDVLPM